VTGGLAFVFVTRRISPRSPSRRLDQAAGRAAQSAVVDAAVKAPESAGLAMSRENRRLTNHDFRMSKVGIRDGSLSFEILRLGVLRFCGSAGRRRSRRSFSNRLKKITFKAALTRRGRPPGKVPGATRRDKAVAPYRGDRGGSQRIWPTPSAGRIPRGCRIRSYGKPRSLGSNGPRPKTSE
jgi:hypothetical protein